MKLLVVGIGNDLRGDDGAGPWVAKLIDQKLLPDVTALAVHQLTPELSQLLSESDRAIFVDASAVQALTEVERRRIFPGVNVEGSTHFGSPEYLLALAEKLFGKAPEAWLLSLPVESFEFGESLTPKALASVNEAVRLIEAAL